MGEKEKERKIIVPVLFREMAAFRVTVHTSVVSDSL